MVVLEDLLKSLSLTGPHIFETFRSALHTTLRDLARRPVVVGFKSVVCYRTGLNVSLNCGDSSSIEEAIITAVSSWKENAGGSAVLRLANKSLNDFVVCIALSIAAEFNKPGECCSYTFAPMSQ